MNYRVSKILVPVDLSATSLEALETAITLAKMHRAEIFVLNVIEPKFIDNDENNLLYAPALMNSTDVLSALIGSIQHAHDLKPVLIQQAGAVSEQTLRTSIAEDVDLIVMGAHGASGYRDGYIGSNTYHVIKNAFCPVLSLPSKKGIRSFKKVIFPIRPVLGALKRLDVLYHLVGSHAVVDVLGISHTKLETDTKVLDKIVGEVAYPPSSATIKLKTAWGNGHGISEDILNYSQHTSADLIVVTNVLDVTTKSGFIGPHTQRIVNCSKIPVLSIKGLGLSTYSA